MVGARDVVKVLDGLDGPEALALICDQVSCVVRIRLELLNTDMLQGRNANANGIH